MADKRIMTPEEKALLQEKHRQESRKKPKKNVMPERTD